MQKIRGHACPLTWLVANASAFTPFPELNGGEALARRSEADLVLDGRLDVRRHDFPRHEIIPILEWAFGASINDCLGASRADLRQPIQLGGCSRVQVDL